MAGQLSATSARTVGELLGHLHSGSRSDPQLARSFDDRQDFLALRVDPYLRVTAERRPAPRRAINGHTERMLSVRECLVHGDYSPKNLLVEPAHPEALILLDHEVCHWGDPTFDTAFCLTHLHLKACTFADRRSRLPRPGPGVLDAPTCARPGPAPNVERDTVGLLGCILAARVDGKSPAEYLTTEELRQRVRALADAILLQDSHHPAARCATSCSRLRCDERRPHRSHHRARDSGLARPSDRRGRRRARGWHSRSRQRSQRRLHRRARGRGAARRRPRPLRRLRSPACCRQRARGHRSSR